MGKGKPAKKNTAAATANDPDELKVNFILFTQSI